MEYVWPAGLYYPACQLIFITAGLIWLLTKPTTLNEASAVTVFQVSHYGNINKEMFLVVSRHGRYVMMAQFITQYRISSSSWMLLVPSHSLCLMLFFHLRLGLFSGLFLAGSSVRSVVCKCYTVCATYHLISSLPPPPWCNHFDNKILLSILCSFLPLIKRIMRTQGSKRENKIRGWGTIWSLWAVKSVGCCGRDI